jgi:small-conductance mechanosensitive channel
VFSNGDLLKSRIHNFMKMPERRVLFNFSLSYRTPRAKATDLPGVLRRIIQDQPQTRFDRAHLSAFTDLGVQYEVVYYILAADYNLYMDIQQAINLLLWEALEREGLSFALPSRQLLQPLEPA